MQALNEGEALGEDLGDLGVLCEESPLVGGLPRLEGLQVAVRNLLQEGGLLGVSLFSRRVRGGSNGRLRGYRVFPIALPG
ncbi:MAG: hypothetical protein O7H41_15725 [Planctomycetota bacterium]|nr:hypothetical protein [Planctomycetota bacterium]